MAHMLVTDVARIYSVPRRTVLRMIDRGELLPIEKLAWETGPYLLDADQVAAAMAARGKAPAEVAA